MANSHIAFHLPVTIDTSNHDMDLDIGGGPIVVTIDSATYDHMGDVAANLETKLQVVDGTFTVVIDDEGKVTIARTGNFQLLFSSGVESGNDCAELLGFQANDLSGAATYTSDYQHTLAYYHEQAPAYDSKDRPLELGPPTFVPNDGDAERTTFGELIFRRIDLRLTPEAKFLTADSPTNEDIQATWKAIVNCSEFTLFTDTESYPFTEAGQYKLRVGKDVSLIDIARLSPGAAFFGPFELLMIKQA